MLNKECNLFHACLTHIERIASNACIHCPYAPHSYITVLQHHRLGHARKQKPLRMHACTVRSRLFHSTRRKLCKTKIRLFRHQRGATFRKLTFQLTSEPPHLPAATRWHALHPAVSCPRARLSAGCVRGCHGCRIFAWPRTGSRARYRVTSALQRLPAVPPLANTIYTHPSCVCECPSSAFHSNQISSSNHAIYTICRSRARNGCSC